MRLQDFSIGAKIVGSIIVLATIILGGTVFSAIEMQQIDNAYTAFLDHDARSWVDTARMRADANDIYAKVLDVVLEDDEARERLLVREIGDTETDFEKQAQEIRALTPQHGNRLDTILAELRDVENASKPVIAYGLKNDYDNARKSAAAGFQQATKKLADDVVAFRDQIAAETNKGSDALSDHTDRTVWLTVSIMVGAILIGIIASWLVSRPGIVKPLLN